MVILSGGPLGGIEVNDWELTKVKKFIYDNSEYFYRNDEGQNATFVGTTYPEFVDEETINII